MLPEASFLGDIFHELFRYSTENSKNKSDWSKKRKKKWESSSKKKGKDGSETVIGPPEVELHGNPSEFAVFAHVRQAVLEAWAHKATQFYLNSSSSAPVLESAYEGDSESDVTEIYHPQPQRLPKIVGVGLRCVLELIRESRASHPVLCTKALAALLDVLQGQQPQGLQGEPAEVLDPLFDLLLDLATCYGPESSAADDGNHLTAIACSCLLSLVIVRGSTGKLLSAAAALLMCPKQLANQNIYLPLVMTALQRSIYAVLLGKVTRPDWLTHGVPIQSKIDSFPIKNSGLGSVRSLASDGQYLYFYTSKGLFKIGSGHGGTIKGHIYYCVPDFFHDDKGWLGFANGWLWLKVSGKKGCELLRINRDPFRVVDTIRLDARDWSPGVWFSDADQLGVITSVCDEGFVVRTLNPNVKPLTVMSELSLKLVRKSIEVMGSSTFDEELGNKTLNSDFEDEISSIVAGKEFGLIKSSSGKVFYSGKASSIGMKSGGTNGRWSELTIPKGVRAQHVAVGHEGLHAVIVTEDGGVFFCGTARRGEDGDLTKARRQPKAVKPKKIAKVENEFVVHAAANNGTTALVTRTGQLLMFGKDTVHCNPSTGQVSGMENLQVTQVALGKAHAVALTSKGVIYTFGINNKGQCGRDFITQVKEVIAMETTGQENDREDEFDWEDAQDMCHPGKHQWRHDLCMICTICRECTGYSISCLSSERPHRNPGQECGCGEGDSGCAICGCCRICAKENVDNSDLAILGPSGAEDSSGLMRLDLIFTSDGQAVRHTSRLQEHLQKRLEERKQRQSRKVSSKHYCGLKIKNSSARPGSSSSRTGSSVPIYRAPAPIKFSNLINEEQAGGSDVERDASRIASLPPAPIALPYLCPVIQIACGLHHTVVLTQTGEVFTFGSNVYGQLGIGDVLLRGGPVNVRLPNLAQSVAAGSNHTAILTVKGEVYTFGSYQKGQLGRKCSKGGDPSTSGFGRKGNYSRHEAPWYAIPAPVPGIGPHLGRRATWVGAAGDQTFIKVDESLINSLSLEQATITGNKTSILLIPRAENNAFKSLAISRRDGGCAVFSGPDQAHLFGSPICLDPLYNVLWSYQQSKNTISCYNIIASEAKGLETLSHSMFDPDLVLPITPGCLIQRSQAALHLLGALDTLAQAQYYKLEVGPEILEKQLGPAKAYTLQDFSVVNRFESHGGGWGYSGHSIEAIRFMADADIILGGFGLFGGRGEYTAKIKLLDIGVDGGEQESDGEVIAETEDIPYECGPRQKYPTLFDEPVLLQGNRWYVAWARISGPSSDCGSNGQATITTEDQISFYFKSSKKSNNGTDVNAGQIPQLLYKVITQETKAPPRQIDLSEPVFVLSKEFSSAVSRECFQSLLALLHWGWNALKSGYLDLNGSISTMSTHAEHERLTRLVFINRASLRLIHLFTNEIYPDQIFSKKAVSESVRLAESIGDVRALLRQILSDKPVTGAHKELTDAVLEECHKTFVLIFHALYPTPFLKWTCLCDLLAKVDKTELHYTQHDKLLSAVLEALCSPTIRLRAALPVLTDSLDPSMRQLCPSDNAGLTVSGTDHHYPLLVEQMSYRTQLEKNGDPVLNWSWKEVLERLLDLAVLPAKRDLLQRHSKLSKELVKNCCNLLARIIAELASQSSGSDEDIQGSCGRVLHVTPSRFLRTNQTKTWNTGNGSPDAICFSVDKPGVVIAGVCVYGGVGMLEYELELLDDQSSSATGDPSPAQRWTSLEIVKGTYGPDDCVSDIAELKFGRPVPIKENIKYAVRLRNQGGRTCNGDGGLSSVKGPDGITFSFSACSLSFNGTSQTRGQIPQILYYSNPQDGTLEHTAKAVAEHQARKSTLSMTNAIFNRCSGLLSLAREKAEDLNVNEILGNSCMITTLLPLVLAHVGPLGTSDPKSAVQIINLIQDLLPHVSALNLFEFGHNPNEIPKLTTSNHYAWVESDHPYKPATVTNYRVSFPESVKWMVIEFSPDCGTAQSEDSLKLYIPSASKEAWESRCEEEEVHPQMPVSYWRVLRTLRGGTIWPQNAVVLPGNEVIFSLETASDYLKNEKACNYGFRCLVVGYEWNPSNNGLRHLESELSFTAGMCAASLIKKDLQLPPITEEIEEDVELPEESAMLVANEHSSLLVRGLALAQIPTISQALDGILPFSCHSNERLFLRDFIRCSPSTSGGRLARWLQPDSYADPTKCEVVYNGEDMRCGWPTVVTVLTRDQYCEMVHVPNLKIEVKAVPIDSKKNGESDIGRKSKKINRVDASDSMQPPLDVPYEVTVEDKICYHSITMMKAYENFSFEELRYFHPTVKRTSENMLVRPYNDGSYCATWTPSCVGWYSILVTIDGYPLEEIYKAEVKEPPQGVAPPMQSTVKKATHQPSRVRKFVSSHSAGLRVRAHPSLQSEQIGVVPVTGTIGFIDEIHNDDGVWLRLNHETMKQYCPGSINGINEAWCLQYNQHLGKTLLLPIEEPKRILDQVIREAIGRKLPEVTQKNNSKTGFPGIYTVVKCGAAGHNVRSRPSFQSAPVGMMVLGKQVEVLDQVVNSEGTWVKINPEAASKFCFNHVTEAWSLARSHNNELYLHQEPNADGDVKASKGDSAKSSPKKGYDFTSNTSGSFGTVETSNFSFTPPRTTPPQSVHSLTDTFVFGFGSQDGKNQSVENTHEEGKSTKDRESCIDSVEVSVKDLAKAIGESRANGNGETPPGTPPRRSSSPKSVGFHEGRCKSPRTQVVSRSRSSSPNLQVHTISPFGDTEKTSQSSSPVPIPGCHKRSPRTHTSGLGPLSPTSLGYSPLVSGGALVDSQYSVPSQRRGSTQSDTSALVSSLTGDLSQSPLTEDLSPTLSSSLLIRSEGSPIKREYYNEDLNDRKDLKNAESKEKSEKNISSILMESAKAVTQTGTQTSPEGAAGSIKSHFSIGSSGGKEERVSPKFIRKDRHFGRSSKRAMSPAPQIRSSGDRCLNIIKEPVKEAMSPSVAESLRAVFSAFLWQEGIVHDAMACASFLKFHPTLPKQGALVVTRKLTSPVNTANQELSREQKQFQRHSVEVSTSGAYLHIQPSTLESLTRSAANANANRTKKKQQSPQEASIKEEVAAEIIVKPKEEIETDNSGKSKSKEIKNDSGVTTVSVLPPALKGLVIIWEELSTVFLKAFEQQALLSSPSLSSKFSRNSALNRERVMSRKHGDLSKNKSEGKRSIRKKKDWKSLGRLNVLGETCELVAPLLVAANEKETVCELCGGIYPHPVTYHMRQAHPGCGGFAGGNGYNSSGNFCLGWAGHCGDGGIRENSWYLICDACRDKYTRQKKEGNLLSKDKKKGSGKKKAAIMTPASSAAPLKSPLFGPSNSQDGHSIMRDNAMFLLDLASSSNSVMANEQQRSGVGASSMTENQSPPDPPGPFSPVSSFQCLTTLGSHLKAQELEEMLHRKLPHDLDASYNGNTQPNSSFDGSDTEDQKGRLFHRSVSMGTSGMPWAKKDADGRALLSRKRNNSSSGDVMPEGGSSLLCHPSATLQKLIPGLDESAIMNNEDRITLDLIQRPSIRFILRRHPIFALRFAMKHSLRKATCRLYGFQALNWLLRNVTQPVCLHDLLWWFVASLLPPSTSLEADSAEDQVKKEDGEVLKASDHPLSDITLAGDAAIPLWKAFHQFLQTVSDLMFLLPPSCALQTMAVRCWGLRFSQVDHGFLHRSQFFNNISKILSRSEEESDDVIAYESGPSQHPSAFVEALKDLTANVEIKVSSRQAMVGSLTDNSTETFWESGDEDRNKTKTITVTCPPNSTPKMIYIHIDNCRDLANKVTSVSFLSGSNVEELHKIRHVEVESRSTGWISSPILDGRHGVIRMEFKGPDNSLRIRQVRILGESGESLAVPQRNAAVIQQRLCESETLKVFRLITSQVFGKLIIGESEEPVEPEADRVEDNNDLKEHMVGILFSRSKLTHLQKQVCMHIVHAIRKETIRVREEWECLLCSPVPSETKPSDTYAFEMLSMVLALSGSSVGRVYLSHQYGLLMDLLSLLHTGSARVQRQVTALLRRVLPEVSPTTLANVLGVEKLPPSDFSIVSTDLKQQDFDVYKIGILDVFLSVVAKSLTVQVKVKGRDVKGVTTVTLATAIHPRDPMGLRWWLRGCISRKLAEDIIQLLNDMSAGNLSEAWANVTKAAIAENIINLTRLEESQRNPSECLKTPTLWLALASLCVLDQKHVERLSSGQWSRTDGQPPPPRPTCTNHDDGITGAIIQCTVCGNLCADCDRYLHLHRRTRMHQRQVCKEEEEAIKVDLHEGCGRTKLFWVLALADSCTLKAMIEFREGSKSKSTNTGICRFCGATGNSGLLAIGNVCADQECQEHAKNICNKIHPCGHLCGGLAGETVCLPCLQNCKSSPSLKQDADDMCMICFTEALSCAPAIQLHCGHVFHAHCAQNALVQRWAGPRITFSFSLCPICKSPMKHSVLSELLKPIQQLCEDVKRKALMRLEYEGLHRSVAITSPGAKFFNDPASYAMDRYAYYVCYKCNKAYYGGEARCDIDMNGDFDPSELVCGGCSDVARAQMCPKHGTDFLEYKCRYCCSVAVFFCFGTTHFCNSCHDDFQRVTNISKAELPNCPAGPKAKQLDGEECPLHVSHPPTGEEFALGCGVCRNAHTF